MIQRTVHIIVALLIATLITANAAGATGATAATARAILFYSPSCPHCHQVMSEDLPDILQQFDQQLDIIAISTGHPDGSALYQAAIERFNIPPERRGVPTLIIGDSVLVGSIEIPQRLPLLVQGYLDQGGVSWPDIPGLAEALGDALVDTENPAPASPTESAVAEPDTQEAAPSAPAAGSASDESTISSDLQLPPQNPERGFLARAGSNFRQDVTGNSLSVLVLLGMIAAVVIVPARLRRPAPPSHALHELNSLTRWAFPLLLLVGLVVSAYMAYVETTLSPAVCGPVGDCNTVQQSPYARLFGLIPIGIVGIGGYLALAAAWLVHERRDGEPGRYARLALFAMTSVGILFSIYLTFLEPFVIGATCLWCLTSALTILLLFILSALLLRHDTPGTHAPS